MSTNPNAVGGVGVLTGTGTTAMVGVRTVGDTFNRIELGADGFIRFGSGSGPTDVFMGRLNAQVLNLGGVAEVTPLGSGLSVKEGANAKQGTATLVAGTVTVANTSVTATSRIFLTSQVLGGTAGAINVTSRVAGTSFTVTSTNAADTSTFAYEIIEPGT